MKRVALWSFFLVLLAACSSAPSASPSPMPTTAPPTSVPTTASMLPTSAPATVSAPTVLPTSASMPTVQPAQFAGQSLPTQSNSLFAGSGLCAVCHTAMTDATGANVSIDAAWRATMMENARWRSRVNSISVVLVLTTMAFLSAACSSTESHQQSPTPSISCPPLPDTFRESDLIGTWVAEYGGGDTDTLILKENGTYKQIYNDPLSGYHFENDLQRWWAEHRASGFLHLHLEGMRRCDGTGEFCKREGGGLGGPYPIHYYAIDYCEGENVEMPGQIILVVTGVTARNAPFAPRGIWLRQMRLPGSEWTYSFELRK